MELCHSAQALPDLLIELYYNPLGLKGATD
jgi:hypothetical protein